MEQWKEDILAHYGVLGMKWGVRRYQNKDGSYTNAGKKRYSRKEKVVDKALKYAKDQKRLNIEDARYFEDSTKKYNAKYGKENPKGFENWLNYMYGDGWKNAKYMKKYFDYDNVKVDALSDWARDLKDTSEYNSSNASIYKAGARAWQEVVDKYSNVSIGDISKKDYKTLKKYAKMQEHNEKYYKKHDHQDI